MIKPDPMMTAAHGAEDIQAMNNRQIWLDYLYALDRRDQLDHPKHGLYTGLAMAYAVLPDHDG